MGNPYLNSGESIIQTTDRVMVDEIEYDVILTSQRLALVDNAHAGRQPQVIPFSTILSVKGGKTPAREPVIALAIIDPLGIEESRTLSLVFSQQPYEDRSPECEIWVKKLIENIVSVRQEPAASAKPAVSQKPQGMQPAVRRWVAPERPEPHAAPAAPADNRQAQNLLDALQEKIPVTPPVPAKPEEPVESQKEPEEPAPAPVPVPKKKSRAKPKIRKVSPLKMSPEPGESDGQKPYRIEKIHRAEQEPPSQETPKAAEPEPVTDVSHEPESQKPDYEEVTAGSGAGSPDDVCEEPVVPQGIPAPEETGRLVRDNIPEPAAVGIPHEESATAEIAGASAEKREEFWEKAACEEFPEVRQADSLLGPAEPETEAMQPEAPIRSGLPDAVVFPVISQKPAVPDDAPVYDGAEQKIPVFPATSAQKAPGQKTLMYISLIGIILLVVVGSAIMFFAGFGGIDSPGQQVPTIVNPTIPIIMATSAPAAAVSDTGVWIKVTCNGTFVGKYGNPGPANQREVRGTGEGMYSIKDSSDLVQATFKKLDYSGDCLTVEVYNNGNRVTQVSKCTPAGSVSILVDPKTGEAPFVPVTTYTS